MQFFYYNEIYSFNLLLLLLLLFFYFFYFSRLLLERELISSVFPKTLMNIFNENYLESILYLVRMKSELEERALKGNDGS